MSARRARTRRSQYGEQLFQVRGLLHLCHSAYRQIIQTTALKVIYLSGYTRDSLLSQETFEEGTEFIEKPFTRDAIPDRISRVLRT